MMSSNHFFVYDKTSMPVLGTTINETVQAQVLNLIVYNLILVLTAKIVFYLGMKPVTKTDFMYPHLHHHLSSLLWQKDVQ